VSLTQRYTIIIIMGFKKIQKESGMEPDELTVAQFARKFGVSMEGVYRAIYVGKIPARKDEDGRWLIPRTAVARRQRELEQREAVS
jgi:hypothetical protein